MGYAKEKAKLNRKAKRIKRIVFSLLSVLIIAFCILTAFVSPDNWKYYFKLPEISKRGAGELRVHFISVGQGDATLIELPDGKTALIDTGNGTAEANKSLLRHLNALDIDRVDYLILTHLDNDHIGGVDELLENKKIVKAFLPINLLDKADDTSYDILEGKILKERCEYLLACPYSKETVGTDMSNRSNEYPYTFTFVYPTQGIVNKTDPNIPETTNETSVSVWLDYKGVSFLFTGDAPVSVEEQIVTNDEFGGYNYNGVDLKSTEILKVAHHGAEGSTSTKFLTYLNELETAIISCGEDNIYKHPAPSVVERLRERGISVYRTDTQGSVIVTAQENGKYRVETLGK